VINFFNRTKIFLSHYSKTYGSIKPLKTRICPIMKKLLKTSPLGAYGKIAALLLAATVISAHAQTTVSTTPVGYVQPTFSPSTNGSTRNYSAVSFPLHGAAVFVGTVASVSGNSVVLNSANLGDITTSPYLLQIASAANSAGTGRSFLITASTTNSVTVSSTAFQVSTILAANDQVMIYPANTLASLLGSTDSTVKLQGGQSAGGSDNIYLFSNNTWQTYYYFTSYGWVLDSDPNYNIANNTVIKPDTAILVGRISTGALPASYGAVQGTVPSNTQVLSQNGGGQLTFVSNPLPTPVTFAQFGFSNAPSWQTGESAGGADNVYLFVNNTWQTYYYFTSYGWVLDSDPNYTIQDNTPIPVGAACLVLRRATLSGTGATVTTPLNYSLN
jgi:uncharacterized protein (TIGR02597 family)